ESLQTAQNAIQGDIVIIQTALGAWQQSLDAIEKELPKRKADPVAARKPPNPKVVDYRAKVAEKKALINKGFTGVHPYIQRVNLQLDRMQKDMTPEELALAETDEVQQEDTPEAVEMIPNP